MTILKSAPITKKMKAVIGHAQLKCTITYMWPMQKELSSYTVVSGY